ncbi:Nn.00g112570.m01.CDS01 [Neocucurbitaria sp. VM-36]
MACNRSKSNLELTLCRKDYMQLLEERLKKVESSLQNQSVQLPVAEDEGNHSILPLDGIDLVEGSQGEGLDNAAGSGLDVDHDPSSNKDGPLILSGAPMQPLESSLRRQLLSKLTEFAADITSTSQQIQTDMDRGCFHRRVFARLPPRAHLLDLVQLSLDKLQLHGRLLDMNSFISLVDEQYAAGTDNCTDNPSRWATINSIFASAVLCRMNNDSLSKMSPIAWSYFKNAFAIFPELVIQGMDILACEALLAMAMFTLRTANVRTTLQLASAAARLAHELGLHQSAHYLPLDTATANRHGRVFWTVYVLNTDLMHKSSLPSPFCNGTRAVKFPEDMPEFVRLAAELSIIQSRIQALVHLDEPAQDNVKVVDALMATYQELLTWKRILPERQQPELQSTAEILDLPLAALHLKYYSSVGKIHMALAILLDSETFPPANDDSIKANSRYPSGKEAKAMCEAAASKTISVLQHLALQPFSQIWEFLCYPLSAALILLAAILANPAAPPAEAHVKLIEEFVLFLQILLDYGCDVHKLFNACTMVHITASCAVDASKSTQGSLELGESTSANAIFAQLKMIRLEQSQITDWLAIAQGLLSNVFTLTAKAKETLSDIFGEEATQGNYGLCVPEFLKSETYNFSFGP